MSAWIVPVLTHSLACAVGLVVGGMVGYVLTSRWYMFLARAAWEKHAASAANVEHTPE